MIELKILSSKSYLLFHMNSNGWLQNFKFLLITFLQLFNIVTIMT